LPYTKLLSKINNEYLKATWYYARQSRHIIFDINLVLYGAHIYFSWLNIADNQGDLIYCSLAELYIISSMSTSEKNLFPENSLNDIKIE